MLKILCFFIAVARSLSLDRAENLDMSLYLQKKIEAALVNCSNKLIFEICLINNGIELQQQAHSPQLSAGLASEY